MKFLIDECLSPELADMASERGFAHSKHVNGLDLQGQPDSVLVQHAIDAGYTLVTNNSADFTALMRREPDHPGLICINAAPGLIDLSVQQLLFEHVLTKIAGRDLRGQVAEIRLTAARKVQFRIYPWSSA